MNKLIIFLKTHVRPVLYSVVVAVIITLGFIIFRQSKTITLTNTQISALTDTVTRYRNKQGQEVAKRKTFSGNQKTIQAMQTIGKSDPSLVALAKDKNNIIGEVHSTETKIDTQVVLTKLDLSKDSLVVKHAGIDSVEFHENFDKTILNTWYSIEVVKKDDSLRVIPIIQNKFAYSMTKHGNGYEFSATNLNPYTTTKDLQSYYFTPDPSHNGKWFLIGGGVGATVIIAVLTLLKH